MKIIVAAALAAFATPAFAGPLESAAVPAAAATAPAVTTANPDQRYCMAVAKQTGSFIDRKVCRTRAEWMKDGIDPTAPRK